MSQLSLQSGLVKVEWQNALLKASKGETRLIPVRIDNVAMPDVLKQNLYIDFYSVGLDVGINQIVNVVQGNSSFTPQHVGFSNLTCSVSRANDESVMLTIRASHFMEPNPNFALILNNLEDEAAVGLYADGPCLSGFQAKPFAEFNGNAFTIAPLGGAITPERPFKIKVTQKKPEKPLSLVEVIHGWSAPFRIIPRT